MDIIGKYFIEPIFSRSGYNPVNTLAYAAIALACAYILWKALRKAGIDFAGKDFLFGILAFVLFGSTSRVLTDLSDAGAFQEYSGALAPIYVWLAKSGIFAYGYLTVTPGIYVVSAILFLASLAAAKAMKKGNFAAYAGLALWLPCAILLLPFAKHFAFFAAAAALAAAGWKASSSILEKMMKAKLSIHGHLAIFGQALDGAATFVVLDIFSGQSGISYFEQHVLPSAIGSATPLGFFLFFLVKLLLASALAYFISKESMDKEDKAYVLLLVAIMGLAPGIRDALRMLCGA